MARLAKDLTYLQDVESGKIKKNDRKYDPARLVLAGTKLANMYRTIQYQQLELIGAPNIRVGKPGVNSPIVQSMEDLDTMELGAMTNKLLTFTTPEDEEK